MRLTQYTDYAMRVLIYLALKGEGRSTISEIADAYGISRNHLTKVVHRLQLRGYITTSRGKSGGMWLHHRPEDINLGEVVRDTEPDFCIAECFGDRNACVITPFCQLRVLLGEARDGFLAVLDGYTLANLIGKHERPGLVRQLGLEQTASRSAHPDRHPA